ncbi:molybdenum cofactor guanylyltransferase [Candidatus Bathycorpusculum sp.]|uniref:molybdenum cofactor guanylyltransferase n=1 Tax=Candidatus Bathycorpusculum sp. TaxID=2994959 RepID=UPI00282BF353|nr:molybdenum cofactor guanylyltransferase [Candidatus Termitimicrobium sp.]MCL2685698.1 molybdenum cofactor guanylyltransferase [Candidatus Termitimicrobium sp.]
MDRSTVILAGGSATRFNNADKGLFELNGRPLLNHVIDAVKGLADEIIIVTNTQERADTYAKIVSAKVSFVLDTEEAKGPLMGALTGFEAAQGEYTLLLPFDSPFVSKDVLELLFDLSSGKAAVIPRNTDMEIEPLHGVYNTSQALTAIKETLSQNQFDMHSMIERLRGVRYISTMVIEQLDPELKTFININTPLDLKKSQEITSKKTKKP